MPPKNIPDVKKLLEDPEFEGERTALNAVIDARLAHHAAEAEKKRKEQGGDDVSFWDVLFGGKKSQ